MKKLLFSSVFFLFVVVFLFSLSVCNNAFKNILTGRKYISLQNIIKHDDYFLITTPSGKNIKFHQQYNLTEEQMIELAKEFDDDTLQEDSQVLDDDIRGISPGLTKKFQVKRGKHDNLYSSKNGIRTFSIWVPDNQTEVRASWYEEVQGGFNEWVYHGSESVKGRSIKFTRTVYLRGTENFRLRIKGITPSKGKHRISYYYINCSEMFMYEKSYKSKNMLDTDTWFTAGPYQKWYWGGCTSWLVANDIDKELLLVDGYVSKGTLGITKDFSYDATERKRVVAYVNIIRHFIEKGYKVTGILTSHRHGDHVGDIPYILGGIKQPENSNFMSTGMSLTGKNYTARIPVVMSKETFLSPYYGSANYDNAYSKPDLSNIHFISFNGKNDIDNKHFSIGKTIQFGKFEIIPYLWYHGRIGDGPKDDIRTLAYNIRCTSSLESAKVFITTGFVERDHQIPYINTPIYAHHVIFGWMGEQETAFSAKMIRLLPDSPVTYNYFFTNHTDGNTFISYSKRSARNNARNMMGKFFQAGLIYQTNYTMTWNEEPRQIRLGYFYNRLGD